ncbi:hypothetical protein [Embleya sp. NPDC001921]
MRAFDSSDPLPRRLLLDPAMVEACAARDIGAVFRLAKGVGLYHSRIARLCEMTPSRVADYVEGRVCAQRHAVLERVADGLRIPGGMLGLAPRDWESSWASEASAADTSYAVPPSPEPETGSGLGPTGRTDETNEGSGSGIAEGLNPRSRTVRLGLLTEAVIETSRDIDIDIDTEGRSVVRVRQNVHNLGAGPLTRLHHELWFERTLGGLDIRLSDEPGSGEGQQVTRLHDTSTLSKFAVCLPEPVAPGGTVRIEYTCTGGLFTDNLFWRQSFARPTERLRVRVRHQGLGRIVGCAAVEEHCDGTETPVQTRVGWTGDTMELDVIRSHLLPGQAVALRWRAGARTPS